MVLEKVMEHEIQMIMFPAREGFILHSLFDRLRPVILPNTTVRGEYVFLTRKSTYLASIHQIGSRELAMGLWTQVPTLQTMLTRFSLEPTDFADIAAACSLPLDERLKGEDEPRLLNFVLHPETVKRLRQKQIIKRELLKRYLGQIGFWDFERVAFVDIGWNGTTQDALTNAFMDEPQWPKFFGWYMGYNPMNANISTPKSTYEGLVFEKGRHGQHRSGMCRFPELFEMATRAAHATTVDLQEDCNTGEIYPVFSPESSASRQAELSDRKLITSIQTGIFDFSDAFVKDAAVNDHNLKALCDYACEATDQFLRYPPAIVSHALTNFSHSEDFGTDIVIRHQKKALRIWNPINWFQGRRNQPRLLWVECALAKHGVPALVGLYNLYRALRWRSY